MRIIIAEQEIFKKSWRFNGSSDNKHIPKPVNISVSNITSEMNNVKLCFSMLIDFFIKLKSFISTNWEQKYEV